MTTLSFTHPIAPERMAIEWACDAAQRSVCQKSKRGVVIFTASGVHLASGWNHPPRGMACDGSAACRSGCRDLCLHAEAHALLDLGGYILETTRARQAEKLQLLHIKIGDDGRPVPSGEPSCPRCSALILDDHRIGLVWLFHRDGLHSYEPGVFHRMSLAARGLPIVEVPCSES